MKMKMCKEDSRVQLLDLPDELLIIILKKLDNVEILYSLIGVNMRLDRIVHDSIFTNQIKLIKQNSSMDLISSLSDRILDRFCCNILPQIHHKIKWLSFETLSMERILLSANNYPNLHELDIFITNEDNDIHMFTDKSPVIHIFQNQIVRLCVNGKIPTEHDFNKKSVTKIFLHMMAIFTNLCYLKFYSSTPIGIEYISFINQNPSFSCSTLVELHINVYLFDDCLYLLDGRLNQLRILFVITYHILPLESIINTKEKLPNLIDFSLRCISDIMAYDEVLLPNLQRMINLENLSLCIVTDFHKRFIDGYNLKTNIINHMPRLNQFIFNIRSMIRPDNPIDLPSNEDIQRTFTNFKDCKVISCVDYFPKERYGQCHMYSYPYTLTYYDDITNNFPGGLFNNVQEVTLFDEKPFQHDFFIRISQSFPFLKKLFVNNSKSQESNNDNQNFSIIEFSHLIKLNLYCAHDDYVEQFLLDTKTCLSNGIILSIDYDQLQRVTHNFIRDATRNNSAKIKKLFLEPCLKLPKHFKTYFPHLE